MSSASKALTLLSHFSTARPEIGLSQLCRLAGRDKATTYRHLQVLESAGFLEQIPATKHYRIGPAVLHLAQLREATVPRKASARAPLEALADATGETAHIAVLSGATLYAFDDCESPHHGTRAIIDINTLPLHATASGLCALAFGPANLMDAALSELNRYTDHTPTDPAQISRHVAEVRSTGLGYGNRSFEDDIQGMAAPLFDHTGALAGTVAVACVASRFDARAEAIIASELMIAARDISRNWGGAIPARIEAAWTSSATDQTTLECSS